MKSLLTTLAVAAMLGTAANAAEITRIGNTPQGLILTGVIVPPGAEVFHLSGQLASPIDPSKPATSVEAFGDTKTQTISIFNKIKGILAAQGYAMSDIFKMTVFVTAAPGMDGKMDFAGFNAGYREFFGTAENPNKVARSTVQVAGLAGPNFLIEIEVTAAKMPPLMKMAK
jgi:enamine deaminase RidA (YjgF/YER057c/UK114 family)